MVVTCRIQELVLSDLRGYPIHYNIPAKQMTALFVHTDIYIYTRTLTLYMYRSYYETVYLESQIFHFVNRASTLDVDVINKIRHNPVHCSVFHIRTEVDDLGLYSL